MNEFEQIIEKQLNELKEKALASKDAKDEYEYGIRLVMFEKYEEGFKFLKSASDKGLDDAKYSLGLYYENGIGDETSFTKAKELYEELIESNSAYGYKGLGDLYFFGNIDKNPNKAKGIELYKKGIKEGVKDSYVCHFDLGLVYKYGDGVKKDKSKAFYHMSKAYEFMDDPEIDLTLGEAYLFGINGAEKDLVKAHDHLLEFSSHVSEEDRDLMNEFNDITSRCKDEEFLDKLYEDIHDEEAHQFDHDVDCDCGCHHHHE